MREALGNSMLFNIVIVFIVAVIGIVIGYASYTKAYRIKNMIINTIEEKGKYDKDVSDIIDNRLNEIGYRTSTKKECPKQENCGEVTYVKPNYHYCVYTCSTKNGVYYRVNSYAYFDVPIIGDNFELPVYGETRIFYNSIN